MISILFVSDDSYFLPVAAAAIAKKYLNKDYDIIAAVPSATDAKETEVASQIITESGFELPDHIEQFENIRRFIANIVICFKPKKCDSYPMLPGNPILLNWQLKTTKKTPDQAQRETALPENLSEQATWSYSTTMLRLKQMVSDLVEQGYLDALNHTMRYSNLIMDNLHEGIIAHDLSRTVFYFNKAAEKITGYNREEILGKDCHEAFPGKFCGQNCNFCTRLAHIPDAPYKYPVSITAKDLQKKKLEMTVIPIKDDHKETVGVIATFRDITKEFEMSLRLGEVEGFCGMTGKDRLMLEVYQIIRDVAKSSVPVLIQGESGTGKELAARAIHTESNRSDGLFVPVNCGALPDNLLESELFGHVKGAFTGAIKDKKGRFEIADKGTLFLDEIGDISPAMQVKLLRVLQDGRFERLGSEKTTASDVRIICATNKELRAEIKAGRFREDLYYRLCVVPIYMPALRERRQDIQLLVTNLVNKAVTEKGSRIEIAPEVMRMLTAYDWPGNVRELINCIQFALVRLKGAKIELRHLPDHILHAKKRNFQKKSTATGYHADIAKNAIPRLTKPSKKTDVQSIKDALAATNNNRYKAAALLGISRATLYRLLEKYQGRF